MNRIDSISKVSDFVGEISKASQEQASGADEINTSLTQVNKVVQQNSSISEETASASEQLSSQATTLRKLMNQFKLSQTRQVTKPHSPPKKELPKQPANINPAKKLPPKQIPHAASGKKIVLDDDDFGKY